MTVAVPVLLGMVFVTNAVAASAQEIDIKVDAALERFCQEVGSGKAFIG